MRLRCRLCAYTRAARPSFRPPPIRPPPIRGDLGEILITNLRLLAKHRNAKPCGFFFQLARSIGPASACRNGESRNGSAVGGVPHLGVAPQIPNENQSLIHSVLLWGSTCLPDSVGSNY